MYSKIHSRLDWFFQYIGEPEEDFEVDLYGDVNFDGTLNVTDVILLVNIVLGQTPTEEEALTSDISQDGIINILDVIQLVGEILGTTFAESVQWLEQNFPSLNTKERLSKLDKSEYFSKRKGRFEGLPRVPQPTESSEKDKYKELEIKYESLYLIYLNLQEENRRLKSEIVLLKRMDLEKQAIIIQMKEEKIQK